MSGQLFELGIGLKLALVGKGTHDCRKGLIKYIPGTSQDLASRDVSYCEPFLADNIFVFGLVVQ